MYLIHCIVRSYKVLVLSNTYSDQHWLICDKHLTANLRWSMINLYTQCEITAYSRLINMRYLKHGISPTWDLSTHFHFEILCLQDFHTFMFVDPIYLHQEQYDSCNQCGTLINQSIWASLLEILCLPGLHTFFTLLTASDLWPPSKNNMLVVLDVVHLHSKYEICPSFPSLGIVFTIKRHTHTPGHTNTHIHTHGIVITKVTISSKPKTVSYGQEHFQNVINDWMTIMTAWKAKRDHSYNSQTGKL